MSYFVMPANIAREAMLFTSNEETRYYLQGFFLDMQPDGSAFVVSTDGHRMGVFRLAADDFHMPAGDHKFGLDVVKVKPIFKLPADLAKHCKPGPKGRDRRRAWLRINTETGAADVVNLGFDIARVSDLADLPASKAEASSPQRCTIDGTIPDWRRVFPTGKPGPIMGEQYNGAYIADFAKLALDGKNGGAVSLNVMHRDKPEDMRGNPAVVTIAGRDDFLGVLMPVGTRKRWLDWVFCGEDWRGRLTGNVEVTAPDIEAEKVAV